MTLPNMDAIVEATMPQQRDCHFSQFCRGLTWSLVKNLIPFFSPPADKWIFISKYAISLFFITHILSSPCHLHVISMSSPCHLHIISISSPYLADMAIDIPTFEPFSAAKALIPRCPGSTCRTRRPPDAPRAPRAPRGAQRPGGSWTRSRGRRLRGAWKVRVLEGFPQKNIDLPISINIYIIYIYTPAAEEKMIWNQIKLLILWMVSISVQHPKI